MDKALLQHIKAVTELQDKIKKLNTIIENTKIEQEADRKHIEKLEEENKKLTEDNRFLTRISKEYMEKENIVEITEFTELYKDDLEKENKKLK